MFLFAKSGGEFCLVEVGTVQKRRRAGEGWSVQLKDAHSGRILETVNWGKMIEAKRVAMLQYKYSEGNIIQYASHARARYTECGRMSKISAHP